MYYQSIPGSSSWNILAVPENTTLHSDFVIQTYIFIFLFCFHRMVWLGKDLKDHLVPTPCHEQGHLPLDQGAQSSIQPGLEPCQGGGSHSLSGQRAGISAKTIFDHLQIRLAFTLQHFFPKQNCTGSSLMQEKKQSSALLQTLITEKRLHPVSSLHIHRIINKHNTQRSQIGATLTEHKNSTENAM